MTRVYYRTDSLTKRRTLRRKPTPAERALNSRLRNSQIENARFRRQAGIGHYIADFYCPEVRLVIELDGASHDGEDAMEYDEIREQFFEGLGLTIIRVRNERVLGDVEGVLAYIGAVVRMLRDR